MSKTQARWTSVGGRALATVALIAAGGFVLQAQTPQASGTATPTVAAQEPILNLQTADSAQTYSSSDTEHAGTELTANATKPFEFLNAMQYGGGRKRYGRPRYRGGNTNADGSPKWDFYVGGGFGMPVSDQSNYLSTGWGFQGGGGRMFNKLVGVNLEFSFDHFGMTGSTVDQQSEFYFGDTAADTGLGANSHVWSLSVQPVVNLRSGEGLGAYVTGGVGFYHKVANFTIPEQQEYCDPYFGFCEPVEVQGVIDHYTSNAPGFDGGFGVTYKFSRFASERLYAEVRYVYMANEFRPGLTVANADTYNGNNLFPQNSQKTSYIPVKIGLRF